MRPCPSQLRGFAADLDRTRLDRLVLLLDTGTPVVRNTAADQLALVQKAHPHELFNLLGRVTPYLKSKQWDTRLAAARAIGGIVECLPPFRPGALVDDWRPVDVTSGTTSASSKNDVSSDRARGAEREGSGILHVQSVSSGPSPPELKDGKQSTPKGPSTPEVEDDRLDFSTFDIINVVKNGRPLLGSAGKEYDYQGLELSVEDRLARAKHDVSTRLGLGAEYMEKDFLSAQDLSTTSIPQTSSKSSPLPHPVNTPAQVRIPPSSSATGSEPVSSPGTPNGEDGLSARQRNMLKRKAKLGVKSAPNKVRIIDVSSSSADRQANLAEIRNGNLAVHARDQDYFSVKKEEETEGKLVVEHKIAPQSPSSMLQSSTQANGWPLDGLVELLTIDLFDLRWETRHGAAMALREVLKFQAQGAGRRIGKICTDNERANKSYLDDLACRLCCVFALDRFGDYVSDQVVAPIRETVSQTLAALLKHLSEESVQATFQVLTTLVFQEGTTARAWEITHGGMLGMKYLVAIRKDVLTKSPEMFDGIIAAVLHALEDHDDDVRAVGAATLIPIASEFVESRPSSVGTLLDVLWSCLADLRDDLSASTGSVMDLLAKLCSIPAVLQVMQTKSQEDPQHSFSMLVPRLYPFLRHTITSVRRAVIRALCTFLNVDDVKSQSWIDSRLLRLIFQNLLVEQNLDVLAASLDFWEQSLRVCTECKGSDHLHDIYASYVRSSLSLVMTPIGHGRHAIALDTDTFIKPSGNPYEVPGQPERQRGAVPAIPLKTSKKGRDDKEEPKFSHNIDGPMLRGELDLVGLDIVLRTRVTAATALGKLVASWPEDSSGEVLRDLVNEYSGSSSSTPRHLSAILVQECATARPGLTRMAIIRTTYEDLMTQSTLSHYNNFTPLLHIVRGQCQALCNAFIEHGRVPVAKMPNLAIVCKGDVNAGTNAFDIFAAEQLIGEDYQRLCRSMSGNFKGPVVKILQDAREAVESAIETLTQVKTAEDIRILASCGAAIVAMGQLPKKLNPIIKSLMDSIKKEENRYMQRRSADALASLVYLCSSVGRGSAADKLIKNLCAFLCVDTSETPEFHRHVDMRNGIYSFRREEEREAASDVSQAREAQEAKTKHLGAQMALEGMATRFQGRLFEMIPKLSECIFAPLREVFGSDGVQVDLQKKQITPGQELIDGLCILRALVSRFDPSLLQVVMASMPLILGALQHEFSSIRHAAASAFAHICKANPTEVMETTITTIIPMLADAGSLERRQGAIEAVNLLVISLDVAILPYVIFLIVPVLGRMSDSDNDIRIVATTTFALLVKLVPLEAGIPDPPGISKQLLAGRDHERKFIQQMLDGSKVEAFEIPVAIKAELRSYQQEGVNWLAFLNKYQLHGILCDDMGLGKTLQTICIVASDHHMRNLKYEETHLDEYRPLSSLIICPPSLSGHWQHEINNYAPFLNCISYVGYPPERTLQRPKLDSADVVITSYDIARNDVDFLSKRNFNYCVLDEGHIIKNAKAKLSQAVKRLKANHRLILSGTPIQNNVLELWSLFDFLMPGFLGTEKTFHDRYAKPIANSRDSKSSSKEQEAGALALEALHKQVLPFLLRRLKEEVLDDLPPKIIQDYYCELSPLQKSLYNDFTTSQASMVAQETSGEMKKENKSHVFQALQYMRKLCNHPALVMNKNHPKYTATMRDLATQGQNLRDVQHAPKLLALKDLLVDCGIGSVSAIASNSGISASTTLGASVVNQHRALIFCQIKDMLDMVENDVLKKLLPSVSYMRLDGTTDPRNRQAIVQEFNADPSIDVLLLTTHVGGLGLNLTGADTVIFVEHDWNPMKDLQAMDRAHRIGQKKTVNVYRLITRGTLEEKIMGLQKFKINIASTIVNQQNSGLATMETDQILDLFSAEGSEKPRAKVEEGGVDSQGNIIKKGQKSVFDDLEVLHNEQEYADFDVDTFVQTL